jgi:hypothetical protein
MMRLIPVNNSHCYHITRQYTSFPVTLTFWLASVIEVCLYQNEDRSPRRKGLILFSLLDKDYVGVKDYRLSKKRM